MEKNIKLTDIISKLKNNSFEMKSISVTPYMPIKEKIAIMTLYSFKAGLFDFDILDPVQISVETEMIKSFDILLAYTNISFTQEDKTFENYDILNEKNVFSYIFSLCGVDYNELLQLINNSSNLRDISVVKETLKSLDSGKLLESVKYLSSIFKNDKTIENMNKILEFNDPSYRKMIDAIKK